MENKALHRAKLNSKISVIAQDIFYYEPNLQFDIIICNHSFEHIGKPIQLMEQINKLLKTNGIFILTYLILIVYNFIYFDPNGFI